MFNIDINNKRTLDGPTDFVSRTRRKTETAEILSDFGEGDTTPSDTSPVPPASTRLERMSLAFLLSSPVTKEITDDTDKYDPKKMPLKKLIRLHLFARNQDELIKMKQCDAHERCGYPQNSGGLSNLYKEITKSPWKERFNEENKRIFERYKDIPFVSEGEFVLRDSRKVKKDYENKPLSYFVGLRCLYRNFDDLVRGKSQEDAAKLCGLNNSSFNRYIHDLTDGEVKWVRGRGIVNNAQRSLLFEKLQPFAHISNFLESSSPGKENSASGNDSGL